MGKKKKQDTKQIKRSGAIEQSPSVKELGLIVFDKRTNLTILLLLGLYFSLSFFKVHTSSIAIWDQIFGIKESKSIIAGTPRGIRQDEWMILTTSLIGQCETGMPTHNTSFGDGNVPVIYGFPIKDFTMLLRPNLWPYFIFDTERAFAFSWNFNIFIFIISTFLLLLLLTKNNFWLSLTGTLFIFLSSAMQWWSYQVNIYMLYLNGIALTFIYLLYSKKINSLIIAGALLLFSSFGFAVGGSSLSSLYPPWQVPMVYLYLFIIVGLIIQKRDFALIKSQVFIKTGILSLVGLVLAIFMFRYYNLVKGTYDILLHTAYPGERREHGGNLIQGKLFSEFFGIFMSDVKVPIKWHNISEASGFIMFFPIVFYGMVRDYLKTKTIDILQVVLAIYVLLSLTFILVGFPDFLCKISLLSMARADRGLVITGIANCFLLICYLSKNRTKQKNPFSWVEFILLGIGIFIFTKLVASNINEATSNFFTPNQVLTVSILITSVYLLIRYYYIKNAMVILGIILIGMNISNITINPLTSGFSAILENPVIKITRELNEKDPGKRWAIFGNEMLGNLIKANGINVFNSVKYTPIMSDMKVLDPSGRDDLTYNRYAHINMGSYIDMKDSVIIKLTTSNDIPINDNYSIFMDPCSPRLKQLDVKYFLFTYQPKPEEVRCMTPLVTSGIFIYKRND